MQIYQAKYWSVGDVDGPQPGKGVVRVADLMLACLVKTIN